MSTAVRILSPETSTLFEMVGRECKHFALSHTHSLPTENVFFLMPTLRRKECCNFSILIWLRIYTACLLSASPSPKAQRARHDAFSCSWQIPPLAKARRDPSCIPGAAEPGPAPMCPGGAEQASPVLESKPRLLGAMHGFPLLSWRGFCLDAIPALEGGSDEM